MSAALAYIGDTKARLDLPAFPSWARGSATWSLIPAAALTKLDARQHPLLALQDTLTGLGNRLALHCILEGLIEVQRPFGLILLDLDGFKVVNDTLGHDRGDQLLQEVASLIQQVSDRQLAVTRLGGDEFAIVAPDISCRRTLMRLASRYCEQLRRELKSCEPIPVRGSAGAALYPQHGGTRSELLKCADVALYDAKRNGRNRAAVFQGCMLSRVRRRAEMLKRASDCLEMVDGVAVAFQPKVDLRTGRICGYEALVRFRDRRGRYRLPDWVKDAFGDIALSKAIGEIVLEKSLAFVKSLIDRDRPDAVVAINVTNSELCSKGWANSLLKKLDDLGISRRAIELEVSESVLLGGASSVACRTLRILHESGIRIGLDDFGTGFASLMHLRSFPIDTLKIDRGFVANLADPESRAIVRAIIDLGRALHMEVVAEGIENEDQHRTLAALGCAMGQGYYHGRPSRAERWIVGGEGRRSV